MAEAATILITNKPSTDSLPEEMHGLLDVQYCSAALMLVGYSLEIALKAMIILREGVSEYLDNESAFFHHHLDELAQFVPELSEKDLAILSCLSHFTIWAGRYPDPGSRRIKDAVDIFSVSEAHRISATDLFGLVNHVMNHVVVVIEQSD